MSLIMSQLTAIFFTIPFRLLILYESRGIKDKREREILSVVDNNDELYSLEFQAMTNHTQLIYVRLDYRGRNKMIKILT